MSSGWSAGLDWWDAVRTSADLLKQLPAPTMKGILGSVSARFDGSRPPLPTNRPDWVRLWAASRLGNRLEASRSDHPGTFRLVHQAA
jgi:hypothetical protein